MSNKETWATFAARMFKKAFPVKAFRAPDGNKVLWLRGLHYFIVTLKEEDKMLPSGRPYQNTHNDYKALSKALTKARIAGLIAEDLMWDNRNDPIICPRERSKIGVRWTNYSISDGSDFTLEIEEPYDFDSFVKGISIDPYYREQRFSQHMYEVVVVTEKLTVKVVIEQMCKDYGVHLIAVKGQSSFTRVAEMAKIAKDNNRPLLLLGIYDLDCAGWDMPVSVMKRWKQIYPHPDHKLVRVALTRKLAKKLNLPPSFDPKDKKYSKKQLDRFIRETGERTCIEIDALSNDVIRNELEKALEKYCRPGLDVKKERAFKKKTQKTIRKVQGAYDFEPYRNDYEEAFQEFQEFYEKVDAIKEELQEEYESIAEKLNDISREIERDLKGSLEPIL